MTFGWSYDLRRWLVWLGGVSVKLRIMRCGRDVPVVTGSEQLIGNLISSFQLDGCGPCAG